MSKKPENTFMIQLEKEFLNWKEKWQTYTESLWQENQRLRQENEHIKLDTYATEELSNMQQKLSKMQKEYDLGFPITEEENEKILRWQERHEATVHRATNATQRMYLQGVSGGRYSYHFLPTALGTSGVVRCSCGAEFEFQKIG